MKEAIASLISDLAERSYPNLWPEFIDGVINIWSNSVDGTNAEICMFVLRNIAEDCTDACFNSRLTTSRRNEILRAIKPHIPNILNITYSFMSIQYQILIENDLSSSGGVGNETSSNELNQSENDIKRTTAVLLLKGCFQMLKRYTLWIRVDQLIKPEHDFTIVCLTVMSSIISCREEACELLAQIISRKLPLNIIKILMEQLPITIGQTQSPQHETDSLVFWRCVGKMIADLISVNAQNIAEVINIFRIFFYALI